MNENQVFKLNQHNISVLTRDLYEYLGKVKCCMDGKRIKWNLDPLSKMIGTSV